MQKSSDLFEIVQERLSANLPFALFRSPQAETIQAIYQNDQTVELFEHYEQSGFIFAPFDTQNAIVLIRGDAKENYRWEKTEPSVLDNEHFITEGKSSHLDLLKKGIKTIKSGELKKVVLSRKITVPRKKGSFRIFEDLLSRYSDALIYFFYHPGVGTWLGATPERFLEIRAGKLVTTSLAGTLPVREGEMPMWTSKELEEQHIVTDFIKEKLSVYSGDMEFAPAETVRSGKLWHLKTDISINQVEVKQWETIIETLHPTPAVCGVPKDKAKAFILKNEPYPREFYTGFLGGLNLGNKEQLELYVNLRCMKLAKDTASVFVGGGITADSDPEKEWLETQYKSQTMLAVL